MEKGKTQLERGNCNGCKWRSSNAVKQDSCCYFYADTGKPFRTDENGNCIENEKGKRKINKDKMNRRFFEI